MEVMEDVDAARIERERIYALAERALTYRASLCEILDALDALGSTIQVERQVKPYA